MSCPGNHGPVLRPFFSARCSSLLLIWAIVRDVYTVSQHYYTRAPDLKKHWSRLGRSSPTIPGRPSRHLRRRLMALAKRAANTETYSASVTCLRIR